MKYELIKDYKRSSGRVLKAGSFIDVGLDKAQRLKDLGYIAQDSKPKKPKVKKPKGVAKWVDTNENNN